MLCSELASFLNRSHKNLIDYNFIGYLISVLNHGHWEVRSAYEGGSVRLPLCVTAAVSRTAHKSPWGIVRGRYEWNKPWINIERWKYTGLTPRLSAAPTIFIQEGAPLPKRSVNLTSTCWTELQFPFHLKHRCFFL